MRARTWVTNCLLLSLLLNSALAFDWLSLYSRVKRQDDDVDSKEDSTDASKDAASKEKAAAAVDLHSGEFCVDVSTYGEVVFEAKPRDKCHTSFQKKCEQKTDQVCSEVTEISCDVVPFTECVMTMENVGYKSFDFVPKIYRRKTCSEGMDTVKHTKMMPECRNVTKQNCITKWETDDNGNQVWAGNEACEPVTWRECKLVARQVDFKVPKISCVETDGIPYMDLVDGNKTQMATKMTCEVKHTTSCKPAVSTKCQNIKYMECVEEPVENCTQQAMMVPTQEKIHRKKCLLPDDGSVNVASAASLGRAPKDQVVLGGGDESESETGEAREEATSSEASHDEGAAVAAAAAAAEVAKEEQEAKLYPGKVGNPRLTVQQQRRLQRQQQQLQQHQQLLTGGTFAAH